MGETLAFAARSSNKQKQCAAGKKPVEIAGQEIHGSKGHYNPVISGEWSVASGESDAARAISPARKRWVRE